MANAPGKKAVVEDRSGRLRLPLSLAGATFQYSGPGRFAYNHGFCSARCCDFNGDTIPDHDNTKNSLLCKGLLCELASNLPSL